MKKIIQIVVSGNTGSVGRIAEDLGSSLLDNNWKSYIAFGRLKRSSKSVLINIGCFLDNVFHLVETRLFDRHGLGSRWSTHLLIMKIKKINPDIIHLHHLHGYFINVNILFNFLKSYNGQVVWTFHDCWSFTGHCCYFEIVNCDKWKTVCGKCPQINQYPKSFYLDRSKKNFLMKKELFLSVKNLTVVSVSHWLGSLVSQSFFSSSNLKMIYNGIDVSKFRIKSDLCTVKGQLGVTNKFVILGVATIWEKRKGFDLFLELSKSLKSDCVIVLVGLTKDQKSLLPLNILGFERTDNLESLVNFYNCADVFCNLSYEETFGLTTVESLSCGTPVIVLGNSGSRELVHDKVGFVHDKFSVSSIINSIEIIKGNGKNSYSDDCRNHAISNFSNSLAYSNYINLYNDLLK
jgi:glycosyltransferase involved in cell wall biosynthesis